MEFILGVLFIGLLIGVGMLAFQFIMGIIGMVIAAIYYLGLLIVYGVRKLFKAQREL